MAFGRLPRRPGAQPMSEINMTPLIDVMLVLLVIFIITAPLMGSSLKLDLPSAEGATPVQAPSTVLLAVDAQGRVFLGDEPLLPDNVAHRLAAVARANPEAEVQLRADKAVPYGQVATLIGQIQQAGLNRIGFVADPPAK
ncbi:ExbD/TolR family protein [Aquabacterium sp. J223]|uniref:ExbD/TolR family protein n=1 Tax=Aquabacterium sp. J223 TaxID=2898431 RepID=UPI0021AE16D9|nr:biopolymer transporter ExbD [Aquabacterium sp. J223]UUX95893.1 biopolymer transporter ExbD [Aquabacterium sp. J223]